MTLKPYPMKSFSRDTSVTLPTFHMMLLRVARSQRSASFTGLLLGPAQQSRPHADRSILRPHAALCSLASLLCCFLKAGELRDKVFTLPEFTILAFHKLLRFSDRLFLVRTFHALYC